MPDEPFLEDFERPKAERHATPPPARPVLSSLEDEAPKKQAAPAKRPPAKRGRPAKAK